MQIRGGDQMGVDYYRNCILISISVAVNGGPACYESAKAIHSPHPGLKIIEQS